MKKHDVTKHVCAIALFLLCVLSIGALPAPDMAAKKAMAERIEEYLSAVFPCQVSHVKVTHKHVVATGFCAESTARRFLVEVKPNEDITETHGFLHLRELPTGRFTVTIPRYTVEGSIPAYDRALSKWAVVETQAGKDALVSHAHYADDIASRHKTKAWEFKSKKGLGAAARCALYLSDFDSLGIHSITTNLQLSTFIDTKPKGSPYKYGGKTYYINDSTVRSLDTLLVYAQKRKIIVNAILLAFPNSIFKDPENEGGFYTMPNLTTPDAVNLYAAVLDFLAQRYSTGQHGRIHNWIVHNEVDMPLDWVNMGQQPELRLYDRYMKSMRICYNILRQYDQHAWVMGSYAHSWYAPEEPFSSLRMMNLNVRYSQSEGDFRWGVAYHPYAINTVHPTFWTDEKDLLHFSRRDPYVTFYNPEVINDWILQQPHFYKGKEKRLLLFSEQGTSSLSDSKQDLELQAAGAAWMWKKIQRLTGVDAMQWHNWKDSEREGAMHLGLRSYANPQTGHRSIKPVWHVWRAAGTDREDEAFRPYLPLLGLDSWDKLIQEVKP